MILPSTPRSPRDLLPAVASPVLAVGRKDPIDRSRRGGPTSGAPVFTVEGRYQARGWTEWTQGFQFGSALLQFDATGRRARFSSSAARARSSGWRRISPISACTITASTTSAPTARSGGWRARGASRRPTGKCDCYELALKVSGAVQARRWTRAARTAGSSIRSTARTRCSSTPSARCARWRSAHRARPAR